ncbi:MAG: sulfur carrier protein ThiS [Candidatus Aenigmarchaeota archaeon]|nr:sulfur carrier protein ThiS [Candidatus Aenigmarchaeota archaeon]
MKVKVAWQEGAKEMETSASTVAEILRELKINPEIVLVSVNNEIVPENSEIKEDDYVEILKVVSGG